MSQPFEQFGKYILLEKLASGGMAEVFLAKTNGANGVSKFLAMKRILPQYSDNPDFIEMFKEEAKICVNLNHGNVVSIYDFGIERQQFYLVMEYVEGRNLRQIINELNKKSISFTTEQIVYIVKEVAAGLNHAHRCIDGSTGKPLNITHRDMSPQNIMVSFEGEVKVIDFGIAKAETQMEATKAGTLKGKFGYMSPEQADGLPIDLRTDVFSLGIVLWELLASDRLFTASNEAAILRKIRDCQIPAIRKINPSVPPELEKIVNKALAKDKNMRYQTAAQMQKDLNRFINLEYPDFSAQDFSVFIKNTFSEVYTESKRKLVNYAKVQAAPEEKSSVTKTKTMTFVAFENEGSTTDYKNSDELGDLDLDNHEGIMSSDEAANKTNIIVDLKGLQEGDDPSRRGRSAGISPNTNATFRSTSLSRSGIKNISRSKKSANRKNPLRGSKDNSWMGFVIVLLLVLGGGYFLFAKKPTGTISSASKEPPSNEIKNNLEPVIHTETTTPAPAPQPTVQPPAQPVQSKLYAVTIDSNPRGAKVFIDGKDTNDITPSRQTLEANKEFTLRLDKAGYFTHESIIKPNQDGYSVNVTLLQGRSGYLNLAIINGGADPIVEINGQRITDKVPLTQYKIPANVPIRIKVSNPFSQLAAEKSILVKENEKITIQLVLTREASKQ